MDDDQNEFAVRYGAALKAALARGLTKSAVASELGLQPQKIYGIPGNPYILSHARLLRLAELGAMSPAATLELEAAWLRARLEKGNAPVFQCIWQIINSLPGSKAKHAWRNLIDAYVRAVDDKKS